MSKLLSQIMLFSLGFFLVVSLTYAQSDDGVPQQGRWIDAGKIYPHDLTGDAATAGNFNFNAESRFERATLFIACDGRVPSSPKLILRMAIPRFQGYQSSQAGTTGTLFVGSRKREAPFDSVGASDLIFLEIALSPAEIATLAFQNETEGRGISFAFAPNLLRSTITADLPPATPTLNAAIQACHVALPPRPPSVAAAVSADQVQHLELAKIALGMTSDQIRSALGAAFQFFPQRDPRYPRLSYLAAVSTDAAYAVTMIDGQVQGFNYVQAFPASAQPLQSNLIAGITAKAWPPIFVRPPYRAIWVTDERGKPKTVPLPDVIISPCAGINNVPFGPVGPHPDSFPVRTLNRVLPKDNGPSCGVTISMIMAPSQQDNATAQSLTVSVANDVAFRSFMVGVNQIQQQKQIEQRKKADQVGNPF